MIEKKFIVVIIMFSILVLVAFICGMLFGIELTKQLGS
jgi:hypothetical protein